MKKQLLLAVFITTALLASGQTNKFKQENKNQPGTTAPGFNYSPVNGSNALKSSTIRTYKMTPQLAPVFTNVSGNGIKKVITGGHGPIYIERKLSVLKSARQVSNEERLNDFLRFTSSVTGIKDPAGTFEIISAHTDRLGVTHIRTIQRYKGIRIYGSESILHADSETERYTGSFHTVGEDISLTTVYDAAGALKQVTEDLKRITVYRDLSSGEKELLNYGLPRCEQVIYRNPDKKHVLAWEIEIRPNIIEQWKYYIHARTGKIILKYNMTATDGPATASAVDLNGITRTVDTYLEEGLYYLVNASEDMFNPEAQDGMIITLDANNTSTVDLNYSDVTSVNNTWNNPSAVSAHFNATTTYRYLKDTHGRNSLNDLGGNIISFVNVTEDDGSSMENAFWNGQAAFYGNGGPHFEPLAGALDVAAHELGHGVVSNTANLEYYGQSGALNESFADIFGAMVDREDWLMGEDITKTSYIPTGALRDMADPHNSGTSSDYYWQPKHISEIYLGDRDNGGVHINSGIGNYAYYLYATAITKDKAEQVYYRALSEYLTKTSLFIDLRIAVIQSAADLYGSGSQEVAKAEEVFDAVGIREEDPVNDIPEYTPNPGEEYLLSYDTDDADPATLYRSSVEGDDFRQFSDTEMKGKASVTDDGSFAVFVSSDSKLKLFSTDPDNPQEDFLSDEPFFDNVAVSKDGKRLAAISTEIDTAIYLYDFVGAQWYKFRLYNPTTSDSITTAGGVLFADAIEFDITGEYLIYDAYNELNSTISEDIAYWDVGFIRVWDNNEDVVGDGSISKLFTSLPKNVSIGNPVFSKNSPGIIAFDYFYDDGVNEEYGIYGANLETGDLELITSNTTLGYPSFSKNDDKIAFSALTTGDEEVVATIGLAADKISPSGDATALIPAAKWPVFYAMGERTLGLAPVTSFTADYASGSAPLVVQFLDLSLYGPTSWNWTFQGGTPATSTQQNPVVTYNTPGVYQVSLVSHNSYGSNTSTKSGYIEVTAATGFDKTEDSQVSFYPNPVTDVLNIICEKDFSIKLLNLQGSLVLSRLNEKQLDVSELKSGMYFIEITIGDTILNNKILKY
ncbi:MAG TPA: M4 family metallopeptidase [Bacteroidales bacterium]|nr:M4 family metallopeptidase [Bacteroidales bacterium]